MVTMLHTSLDIIVQKKEKKKKYVTNKHKQIGLKIYIYFKSIHIAV